MEQTLKTIRDLTVIVVVYLYFIAWVYVHFYYQQYGISTESIKIDYNSYLMYSYNVLTSGALLYWVKLILLLIVLRIALLFIIASLSNKFVLFKKLQSFLSNNQFWGYVKKLKQQNSLLLLIVFGVIVFPLFFKIARRVAIENYEQDRKETKNLKTIQFIFRKDAEMMSPATVLDSTLRPTDIFYHDISLLKNDPQQLLRLLAESEQYYIVLQQRPFNKIIGAMPSGYVYYINKKDVLISKITLRSF